MKNCAVIFQNERTEFVIENDLVTITQIEDGEIFTKFTMTLELAENLKKTLLEDEGAEEVLL